MNAAEKLKALAKLDASTGIGHIKTCTALRNALPQIVAVVEAAEHVTFYGQEAHRYNEWHGSEIALALSALDEALT